MKIGDLRREYPGRPLRKSDLDPDPVSQFEAWFRDALEGESGDVNSVALATAGAHGRPSVRIVLLKDFGQEGFTFFTNYASRKGRELAENPEAAMVAYWAGASRQVRIEGSVVRLSRQAAEEYFQTRPRGSQLSALISPQSDVVERREQLEREYERARNALEGESVPTPPQWGGYSLQPVRFEFWQGREDRLHDRFQYVRDSGSWRIDRLAP